ncbi:unnamed protein product [Anisakis simplex]|uniref:Metalloendopeptidase n=1 Tax=Anisakis simplex TaxID=6269 RepID=A0A0M3KGA8_ANISI|nr:unnamed protein product [Anisakis simplex]
MVRTKCSAKAIRVQMGSEQNIGWSVSNSIRYHRCYAAVGRMPGRNVLMLEANNMATCIEHDIVVHELMHTIGLWHEHMRRDRDEYIKIHSSNVAPREMLCTQIKFHRYISQFDQVPEGESDTYGIRYNYRSLMHYGKNAFAKRRGLVTIETIDPAFQDVIGRAQDAAPSDYYKICSIYDCGECMGKTFSRVQPDDPHRRSLLNILMETTIQPPPKAEFTAKNSVTKPEASNSDHNFNLFESIFSFLKRLFQKSDR